MQAIILAAGKGSRLKKHTENNTKCMLEVAGQRLIDHSLKALHEVGVNSVILVVGYQKNNLMRYLGNEAHGVSITYVHNDDYNTTNNIYSLYLARDYLLSEDTLLLESDLIYDVEILKGLLADNRPSLAVVDKYESWMDGTVVTLDAEDRITSFVPKKFFDFKSVSKYYKTVNIYKFSKEFSRDIYVPFLTAYSSALGKNEYYEQVLRVVLELERQELQGYRLKGEKWYEIDDIQDKDNAEAVFAYPASEKYQKMTRRFGGYWRYPKIKDFCYLVNPYFPTEGFLTECKAYFFDLVSQYPSGSDVQRLLAGKLFEVDPELIAIGNGAAEIIKILGEVIPGVFGIMHPTFYEYVSAIGKDRVISGYVENESYTYSVEDLIALASKCDNLILINPDNPSGHFTCRQDVIKLLNYLEKEGKRLIIDESFIDFISNRQEQELLQEEWLNRYKNLLIIKSISKSYGVPGFRLGVAVSSNTELIEKIQLSLGIWNVNSFGEFFLQIIGKYLDEYQRGCDKIIEERNRFYKELQKISFFTVYESKANYFLVKVNERLSSKELSEKLLDKHDILIKDLSEKEGFFGKNYIRIAIRNSNDNEKFLEAIENIQYS